MSEDTRVIGGDFTLFVTRLGIQALIALGVIENPVTGERTENLVQARMLAADLEMLLEKTAGNLSPGEESKLREIRENLRLRLES